MPSGDEAVLEQSTKQGLGDLLAAEVHLEKVVEDGVEDSWCARKHLLKTLVHSLPEASQHCRSWDKCSPETYDQLILLTSRLDAIVSSRSPPDPVEVKRVRNAFREVMDPYFPHITQVESSKECAVCRDDSLSDVERFRLGIISRLE